MARRSSARPTTSSPPPNGCPCRRHPRSFLNGTPSEGDDPDLDYEGRRLQASTIWTGNSRRDVEFRPPALYVLDLESGDTSRSGWSAMSLRSLSRRSIRPHEATPARPGRRPDRLPRDGRLRLVTGRADVPSPPESTSGRADHGSPADRRHARGRRPAPGVARRPRIQELMAAWPRFRSAYIIDGHHRVAATVAAGHGSANSRPGVSWRSPFRPTSLCLSVSSLGRCPHR